MWGARVNSVYDLILPLCEIATNDERQTNHKKNAAGAALFFIIPL